MTIKNLKIGEAIVLEAEHNINIVLKCSNNFVSSAEISKFTGQ